MQGRLAPVVDWLSRLLGPALVVSFLPFVALCFGCFPVADDFVLAGQLDQRGLLGAQAFYFREWTGKYSGILGTSLFLQCFGLGAYWLAPLLLIAGTLVTAWLVVRGAVDVRGRPALLAAAVLGAFFLALRWSPWSR
jgi:hypothetical protein